MKAFDMTHETVKEATSAATAAIATKATNWGAAAAVAGGFLAENWVSIGGLLIAFSGFLVNWYYKHQELKIRCDMEIKRFIESQRSLASDSATNDNCNQPRKEIP